MTDGNRIRERAPWILAALAATLLIAGCGEERIEGDLAKGGDPAWKPRETVWDRESGVRHQGGDGSAAAWVHAGEIEARNELSSGTISSAREGAGYACRRIQIHALDGHPLVGLIAEKLVDELSAVPRVEAIVQRGFGSSASAGEAQPDLELWLRLGGPVSMQRQGDALRLRAELRCHASNGGWPFQSAHADQVQGALVRWSWNGTLAHESTTTLRRWAGRSAPALRLAAQNIASEIGKALVMQVTELGQEHGPAPEVPPRLRVSYQETPEVPWPEGFEAILFASHVGPLTRNHTTWTLHCARSPQTSLTDLRAALEADGWQGASDGVVGGVPPHLHMRREGATLHVEPLTYGSHGLGIGVEAAAPSDGRLVATYSVHVTREELQSRVARLDSSEADPEWLLSQRHLLDREGRRRLSEALLRRPPRTWVRMIQLGRLQHELGEPEQIPETMKRAAALAWLAGEEDEFADVWKKRAEEWELEGGTLPSATRDGLVAVGAIPMQAGTKVERVLGLDEELVVFVEKPEILHSTLFRVDPRPPEFQSGGSYVLFRRDREGGTTSWGHSPLEMAEGEEQRLRSVSGRSVVADVTRVADIPVRFRLRLSLVQ